MDEVRAYRSFPLLLAQVSIQPLSLACYLYSFSYTVLPPSRQGVVTAAELQDEFGMSPNVLMAALRELEEKKEVSVLDIYYIKSLL